MPSFKIRNSRTKLHNSDGSRIYNTFNSTGLVNKYQSQNSRFNARNNTGRTSDIIDPATDEPYNNCSCTIAGCGKQCCRNYFLIENITQDIWYDTLDSGTVFQPGNIVSTAYVVSNIPNPPFKEIGIIEDIIFPNAYECIPLGQTRAESKDCSGAFPLNVRLIIRSSGESCVLDSKQHYIGPGIFGLFFKQPNQSQSSTTGVWSGMPNASNLYIQHEEYKVLGSSRVGAPYRNPIAGYRKTLACCCKSNKGSQPCYKGCKGACYIELALQTAKQFKTPRPMRNDYIYLSDGKFFGYVTDFGYNTIGPVLRFSFNNNTECTKNQQKLNSLYPSGQITLYRANGSLYQDNSFTINYIGLKVLKKNFAPLKKPPTMCIRIPMLYLVNKIPECVMTDVSDRACNQNNNFVLNILKKWDKMVIYIGKSINAFFVLQVLLNAKIQIKKKHLVADGKKRTPTATHNTIKIVQ